MKWAAGSDGMLGVFQETTIFDKIPNAARKTESVCKS